MKIYIAARWHEKEKVSSLQAMLIELGHEITHDWTKHQYILPYQQNLALATAYAHADIEGVKNADLCLFLTNPEIGAGSATELGAAILCNLLTGKPDIYVVGEDIEKNLFYYHPVVQRLSNLNALRTILEKRIVLPTAPQNLPLKV